MSTQVTYKGSTIASFANTTKTLKTSGKYMEDDVAITESISLQSKTVTPTETATNVTPDSGYEGLSKVTVNAISSTYVGTGIARKSSSDLTASGSTVTVPVGYYSAQATKNVAAGTAKTPAVTITKNPTVTISSTTGIVTATYTGSSSITPTVTAGYIAAGTAGTVSTTGTSTLTLSTQAAKTVTPTETVQRAVSAGYYTTGNVSVAAISSTYVGTGVVRKSAADITTSGSIVTIPYGYYSSQATKAVLGGDVITPATTITGRPEITIDPTTGRVSATFYSSISLKPSVTTAGYIAEINAHEGTITVSASSSHLMSRIASRTLEPVGVVTYGFSSGYYAIGDTIINSLGNHFCTFLQHGGSFASGCSVKRNGGTAINCQTAEKFTFDTGDTLAITGESSRGGVTIYYNGESVASTAYNTSVTYNLIAPNNDITIEWEYASADSSVWINDVYASDIPVFVAGPLEDSTGTFTNVTCNKTFQEVWDYFDTVFGPDSITNRGASILYQLDLTESYIEDSSSLTLYRMATELDDGGECIEFLVMNNGGYIAGDLIFYPDESIEYTKPSSKVGQLLVDSNGSYVPWQYGLEYFNSVTVDMRPRHTVTLKTGGNMSYAYVFGPDYVTKYYTLNDTITVPHGEHIIVNVSYGNSNSILVNGTTVSSGTGSKSYTYEVTADTEITFSLSANSISYAYIRGGETYYTASITRTGPGSTSYPSVRISPGPATAYRLDGETFRWYPGENLYFTMGNSEYACDFRVNDTIITSNNTYTYTPPNQDISLEFYHDGEVTHVYVTYSGGGGGGGSYQTKTVTPSTSQQIITPDSGYDALSSVTVNAMPVGTTTSPTSISSTAATVTTGTNTITLSKTVSVTPRVTTAGYVSSGTAGNTSVSLTANVTTKAAATITPGTSSQTIASGTYLTGTQTISGDSNLVAGNIKSGTTIFGVTGTYGGGGGSTKNVQVYAGNATVSASTYTATAVAVTATKAGTYKISWTGCRNTNSGTSGSQVYVNNTAKGSAHTSFTNTYWQYCEETLALNANDSVVVRARARSTSYRMMVGNLIITEQ